MAFSDIPDQKLAKKILVSAIKENRISHSYLFYGPQGSGKKELALEFAKRLNCLESKDGEACGDCPSCRKIAKGTNPDVQRISPSGPKQIIGIEAIKKLQRYVTLKSIQATYKIFIIEEAEKLNKEASNSFLKILEEPPREVVIILISAFPDKIIPTILSRCQRVRFIAFSSVEGIEKMRQSFGISEEEACLLYYILGGKTDRVNLWFKAELGNLREEISKFIGNFSLEDYERPLLMAEAVRHRVESYRDKMKEEREEDIKELKDNLSSSQLKDIKAEKEAKIQDDTKEIIRIVFLVLKSLYRDIWAIKNGREFIVNKDKEKILREVVKNLSSTYVTDAMEEVQRKEFLALEGANLSLTLQTLFINLVFCNKKESAF